MFVLYKQTGGTGNQYTNSKLLFLRIREKSVVYLAIMLQSFPDKGGFIEHKANTMIPRSQSYQIRLELHVNFGIIDRE